MKDPRPTLPGITLLAIAIGVVVLVALGFLSNQLAAGGDSYAQFQSSGSGIGSSIARWSSDLRWAAVGAVLFDVGFAALYGFSGALLFGWMADCAAIGTDDRAGLRYGLFTVAAWSIVLVAAADLLENLGLLVALALFGLDARTAQVGAVVHGIGVVKWVLLAVTGGALVVGILAKLPGYHRETIYPETP